MYTLRAELNRSIFSKGFAAGVIGTAAVLGMGAFDRFQQLLTGQGELDYGTHITVLLTALASNTMLMALPVLAALPATTGFVEDWKSGYLKHCLPRVGARRYISAKAIAAGVAGAMVIFAGIALAYGLLLLLLLPGEKPAPPQTPTMLPDLLGKALLFALSGALWSLVGLACSTATLSTHMAYASPFLLCYMLVILSARYFPGVAILNPQQWLMPQMPWPGGNWGAALLVVELAALAALSFHMAAARRLRHESA